MRQVENLRGRLSEWNPRAQWVQLGLLSASIMAPLIGRWNELRTAERARALREEAEARLRGVRVQLPWQRNGTLEQVADLLKRPDGQVIEKLSARGKVSARLWLVGVGIGLVAAGAGAYVLVRRRMEQHADDPLVDLPLTGLNGYTNGIGSSVNGGYRTPVTSSFSATTGAARPATDASARPSVPIVTDRQAPIQPSTQSSQPEQAPGVAAVGASAPADERPPADIIQPDEAPFIGNIRTMIYHEADADNLPAEENRIYFASEEEARTMGYRRDRDEIPATGAEPQAQSNA